MKSADKKFVGLEAPRGRRTRYEEYGERKFRVMLDVMVSRRALMIKAISILFSKQLRHKRTIPS